MKFLGFVHYPSPGNISEREGLIGRWMRFKGIIFLEGVVSMPCVFPLLTGEAWWGDGQGGMVCFLVSFLIEHMLFLLHFAKSFSNHSLCGGTRR